MSSILLFYKKNSKNANSVNTNRVYHKNIALT
jgi:hypothetical protein